GDGSHSAARGDPVAERRGQRRGHERQHLPLRHLSSHPRRHHAGCEGSRNEIEGAGMNSILNLSRREFLQAAGGLALGFYLPQSLAQSGPGKTVSTDLANAFSPNAFIRISPDNTVTVIVKHLEMGQGTYTGLPTLVAEELDADWSQIRAEGAPADAAKYNNLLWGPAQGTGGSTALANSWEQMRKAGAAARAMLVAAAAEKWQVPVSEVRVSKGVVSTRNHKATFGQLAADAAKQKV